MPKHNLELSENHLEPEEFQGEQQADFVNSWRSRPVWLLASGGLVLLVLLVAGTFELVYAGKILPGVSADGAYLGGLSESAAVTRLDRQTSMYAGQVVHITNGTASLAVPIKSLNVSYDTTQAASLAIDFGSEGSLWNQLHQHLRAFFGRTTSYSAYSYSDAQLAPYLLQMDSNINTPAIDAALSFDSGNAKVTPGHSGVRLDLGQLTQLIDGRLAQTSAKDIMAPVYQQAPKLGTAPLQAAIGQVASYLSAPITLKYSGTTTEISQSTLTSWIQAQSDQTPVFLKTLNLNDLYPPLPSASLSLNQTAVSTYVAGLASDIDKTAQNAVVGIQNGQPVILQPSHGGQSVDQTQAVNDIISSLSKSGSARTVALNIQDTTAAVNETDLPSLGINQLISEGETYFPGSPYGRLVNVRAGAAKFNNVLIAPGEVFSMGAQLGEVDASTGYLPELVIIGNHEELQYGGGLCQVNTTAFRAALLAGLPIDEREAHSFAISYYQWPYSAPGVDATIYYPQVDLKFTNDTGHYILIQTTMVGDDLKFDFYGTKVESGTIRGPYFVTGSNNATQASHTVFYRDVDNAAGQLVRTDTFNSYYQPSTDFPIVATSN